MGLTVACPPLPPGPIQLQKNKEQEEQLGEMIQAYEKLCVEKSDLETELGEMVRPGEPGVLEGATPRVCVCGVEPSGFLCVFGCPSPLGVGLSVSFQL